MRGLAQPVSLAGTTLRSRSDGLSSNEATDRGFPANRIIGVVCSGDVAVYRDQVKSALERGKAQRPDAVWVCIEPKSDRMTHDVMLSLDIEPVVLPMNPRWKRAGEGGYDLRRVWRDNELLHLCDELIVFHKRTGSSPWRDRAASGLYEGRLFVVELGPEPKARTRKTRKLVGA